MNILNPTKVKILNKILRISLMLVCLSLASCSVLPSGPEKLGLDSPDFKPSSVDSWVLPNGLKVLYSFNDEVPLVSGALYVPGGALFEDSKLVGLASATGSQMRGGGTTTISPDRLDLMLDNIGASIETGFGDEFGTFTFSSLGEDFEKVFSLFADVIRRPGFDEKRFSLWKQLTANGIIRRKDSPETMASMAFADLIYGEGSPYSRSISSSTLRNITRSAMKGFYRDFVGPSDSILVLTGSVSKASVREQVDKQFSQWPQQRRRSIEFPKVEHTPNPGVYVLERNFPQAVVLVGHRGPKRHSADRFPMHIFNRIFGHGGMESLLFNEIRSRRGLAYSVYGGFSPGPASGEFQVYAATRVEQALEAVKGIVELAKKQKIEAPSPEVVDGAINSTSRNFVFKFSSPAAIATREALLEMLKFPVGYNETFVEKVKQVTPEQVFEVAQKRLQEEYVIVLVGKIDPDKVQAELKDFGPVHKFKFDEKPIIPTYEK